MREFVFFLRFLYGRIRFKLILWGLLVFMAAALDGLSIGLFLPILEGAGESSPFSQAVEDAFDFVGIEYSLTSALIVMVLFFSLRTAFIVFQEIFAKSILRDQLITLKSEVVDNLFKSDFRYFIGKEVGYFTNAVTLEYSRAIAAFEMGMNVIVSVGFAVVYLAIPTAINPVATLVVLACGIPIYFAMTKVNKITRNLSVSTTTNNTLLQSTLIQAFNNYKYLKATGADVLTRKVFQAARTLGNLQFRQAVLAISVSRSTEFVLVLLVVGIIFAYVVVLGTDLLQVLFLIFLLRRAVGFGLKGNMDFRKFIGSTGSLNVLMQTEREVEVNRESPGVPNRLPDFARPITFEGVSFSYDGKNDVLKDVNLVIPPKSTVAFVGTSGAGKSTLVTLLTCLLEPTSGRIMVGDDSIIELDRNRLRQDIGYVTQESVIFTDTVRNNITLWEDSPSSAELDSAISGAHLEEFVDGLPERLDTPLGDEGINISGGQRQRINIARELFKNTSVLIFDEATSSLDSFTEREIQQNIDEFKGEKTIILIAHRLSTIRNSDTIFVLKDGEIVEHGAYEYLYSLNGEFRRMVDQQALVESMVEDELVSTGGDAR